MGWCCLDWRKKVTGIPNTWNKQHVHESVMGAREARGTDGIWSDNELARLRKSMSPRFKDFGLCPGTPVDTLEQKRGR